MLPLGASVITKLGQLHLITNWGKRISNWGSFMLQYTDLRKLKLSALSPDQTFLVLKTTSNLLKKLLKDNPGENICNKFCSITESNAWMKGLSPTSSNNVAVSLHTLITLFIGLKGNCLTCTCLFVRIYFGQECNWVLVVHLGKLLLENTWSCICFYLKHKI